jgi:hypothetical protein
LAAESGLALLRVLAWQHRILLQAPGLGVVAERFHLSRLNCNQQQKAGRALASARKRFSLFSLLFHPEFIRK